ncbi:hypothetical protein EDD66_10951 [Mobilisporobacter senegalensis]|uniref:DUF4825 domain-containing protein n=1 Tax=Mobilisporobacter senegalensis TaxID=1329262 RepID=A0A3N1XI70_9FIRM|nr:hypothetical protein [Mobilisporobacter senegalensis]ROR25841.1 hypothetical protein EDD66_10951 [Mobilisporobacter senegalensis]
MGSRKSLTLILSLAFVLFILSGCQNQNKHDSTEIQDNQGESDNVAIKEIGYIYNFNTKDMNFDFDSIEWITVDNPDRIKDLKLDIDTDLTNGFYINNPETDTRNYSIRDNAVYEIIDWNNSDYGKPTKVSLDDFITHLDSFIDYTPPFWIVSEGDEVISISEQYTP